MRWQYKRIPVFVVGAGNVANTIHIPIWKNMKKADLVGIYDINKDNAERVAKNWKIPCVYTDFVEMLEKEEGAIIDVCTPPVTHASLSVEAMKTGHHVILEKPMAMSTDECEKIIREYQKRKGEIRFCVVHNALFANSILQIKSIIAKKRLDILSVDIKMLHTPNDEMISDRSHWVHSLPGGRFGECLIHPIYVLRNLIGKLNVRDVYSVKRGSYYWVNYDELYATFDSCGKHGAIHSSFNSPRWTVPLSIRVYAKELIINHDGTNSTITTQGALLQGYLSKQKIPKIKMVRDSLQSALQIIKSTSKTTLKLVGGRWKSGHENLFASFVSSILESKKLPYTPEEAYEATRTFLEVLKRLEEQRTLMT